MDHSDFIPKYLSGQGVEIGAYTRPIRGINPIYVDRYATYAGSKTNAEYYGDACELPFYESSLDYVASSHLLEHSANPLAALKEWFRVLKHGGYMYMVIPDYRETFDHPRALTTVEHMLDDYRNNTGMNDPTHVEEFSYGVDWKMFSPDSNPEDEEKERKAYFEARINDIKTWGDVNIHFHTFRSSSCVELIETGNRERIWPGQIEVVEVIEKFPDWDDIGFLVVAKANKNRLRRFSAAFSKKGLRPDARKL